MKNHIIIAASFLFLSIFACSNGNEVSIVEFSPSDNVERLTTFTVKFSKDLAPSELVDKWSDEEFIKFEPGIQGKFKWIDKRTLLFSPDSPLEPIQKYNAEVTDKVLFNAGYPADFKKYQFHTPDFDAVKVDFFWSQIPNRQNKLSIQANVHFNYPVSAEMFSQFIGIESGGEEVKDFEIVTQNASEIIAVNLGEVHQTDKKQELIINVKKGLQSIYGKKSLEDARSFKQILPPIVDLVITGVSSGFDGTTGWLEVKTTQMVDEKKLKEFVALKPLTAAKYFVSENAFRIEGDFSESKTFELIIKKGLPGLFGGTLEEDFIQTITMVDIQPSINFSDKKGKYLLLGGEKNIEFNSVNIPAVDIEVSKIYKNNLVHFLNNNSYYGYYEYDYYGYNPSLYTGNYGKILYEEKVNLQNSRNWLERIPINLDKAINSKLKGIYTINVRSTEERWVNDSKMIAVSDLGIIAKKSKREMLVFINSIADAVPVADVSVEIISSNNQTLLSGKTDASGVIHFKNIEESLSGFTPKLVIAEKNDDFNYIDLSETNIETSRFDVGGLAEHNENYTAFIYAERNLYRPGERVNISAIIRTDQTKTIESIPVSIKVISPTGKLFDEFKVTLNEQGSFELAFFIPDYAQTGQYRIELFTGGDVLIGSYGISVEDFAPDKIRVTLNKNKDKIKPGEKIDFNINAEFLFGAKAANLRYEADIQLKHRNFFSKSYPQFDFSNTSAKNLNIDNTLLDGKLDENGNSDFSFTAPSGISSGGIITGSAFVSVFDLTGRTVNRAVNFDVFTKDYFLGIRSGGYYFGTNQNINFQFAAVDEEDKPLNDFKCAAKLVRYEWQTVLRKDYSDRYFYASEKKEITVWEKDVIISRTKDYSFQVDRSGEYELRLFKQNESDYIKSNFYAYDWASSTASSFQVDKEGRVDITFDKEIYEPGQNAKILLTAPFSGRMLITVERNGVYDYRYVDVNLKSVEVNIPVKEEYLPNVYVTATIFKKHSADNSTPFLVGHGFKSVKVEKKSNKLPVAITAPEKIKPRTKHDIKIKSLPEKNIFITFAAVDEGILQIKNFETPDPYGYMNAKRALKVESYDLYKLLLPEIISLKSPGGGEALAMALKKRTNPVTSKRFNLVSYWSGIRKTDSKGEVVISLEIPQFNGELRLMALAYSGSRFGSSDKYLKVADDIIIEPEAPRFLSPKDSLRSNVTVINTTNNEKTVNLKLSAEGTVSIKSANEKKITIKPNSTANASFDIIAGENIGKAKLIFETSGSATVKEEIEIGVRPVSPFITEAVSGTVKAGKKIKLEAPKNFLSSTQNTSVTISKFPAVQFAEHLKFLVGYPHGCIEQTVSKLFPQLYFEELAKLVAPDLYRTRNPVYFLREGIKKIESMQLYDGSIAYWHGGNATSWWGSIYAAHFLLEAKKNGFKVNDGALKKLMNYISAKAREKSTFDYVYYEGSRRSVKKIASKEVAYTLYVLALAERGDISTMNYYKARPHLLSADSKYLIAGAYALMGKMVSFNEFLPKEFTAEKPERESGRSFDSEARANSIMLNVLLEVDPANTQIASMIKHISSLAGKMYSTQERAFAFLALGKAAKLNADTDLKVKIISNDKTIAEFAGKDITISDKAFNKQPVELQAEGKGEVYYFHAAEGIKLNERIKEEDSNMKVRREYFNYRTKGQITGSRFAQGDLIVCKISLEGFERSAENIIISDLIPAGFEIENPRLNASTELTWQSGNPMNVEYMDIRDDRLILFTNLYRNKKTEFYYMLRAVNNGSFELAPVSAEGMYDNDFRSYNGQKKIFIHAN